MDSFPAWIGINPEGNLSPFDTVLDIYNKASLCLVCSQLQMSLGGLVTGNMRNSVNNCRTQALYPTGKVRKHR